MRYFISGERHVSRLCREDVLLLVYDGVLRFRENGVDYEVRPGQYHIQRHDSLQSGPLPSDAPKYLYVHFLGDWTDSPDALPPDGSFPAEVLMPLMELLDQRSHAHTPYILQVELFYRILSTLYLRVSRSQEHPFAAYVEQHYREPIPLDQLCREFHYSKNQIIQRFREVFGMTPVTYINHLRIKKAEYLIEVTSERLEDIAAACGFQNYSHFYKQFIGKHGVSPERWRTQKRLG